MPIVCRDEDDKWHPLHADLLDDLECRGAPELDVEEDEVGLLLDNRINRAVTASAFTNALNAVELRQLLA
jgi:hypothetical protein